ncbi:hypothetical protein Fmac_012027 [Flemingia macrophylla]|uniref:C2H2-type domain-containing protein n=1 Tax=Flemingia macrophylla TaxID=520843 RepID=A0ABD1MP61_9FABA
MEKHKCKLCFRSFANGRALGGHMRSHMMNLPIPPKANELSPVQLSFEAESSPSESSSSFYGLRENPKKSFRFADPEFSFADTASVILQDRESETESSKNPTRKRSKRAWQLGHTVKNIKFSESASSVSDTTTEEDVAFCLMMLSRDNWEQNKHRQIQHQQQRCHEDEDEDVDEDEDEDDDKDEEVREQDDDDDGYESEELKPFKKTNKVKGRYSYKCETCDKVFRSYQALGGHRASHKKIKLNDETTQNQTELVESEHVVQKKIHQCPVCFRVFASGQALGGHKRTHVIASPTTPTAAATVSVRTTAKVGDSLLDLNLPAPVDEYEDVSQFDDSAVSDAEFVKL